MSLQGVLLPPAEGLAPIGRDRSSGGDGIDSCHAMALGRVLAVERLVNVTVMRA